MKIKINKFHGCGNDFLITEDSAWETIKDKESFVKKICARRFGAGADGFLYLKKESQNEYTWEFYNSDGSYAEMCGNAARCVGQYLFIHKNLDSGSMNTGAGKIFFKKERDLISVKISSLSEIKTVAQNVYMLNTGVPHIVVVDSLNEAEDIKNYRMFDNEINEKGCNVTFISTKGSPYEVKTFERGVEAFTLACGTGAVAAAAIMHSLKNIKEVDIKMPGGPLQVRFQKQEVFLVGPAVQVYQGDYIC